MFFIGTCIIIIICEQALRQIQIIKLQQFQTSGHIYAANGASLL